MEKVKAIPDGFSTVTPYLYFQGAAKAIDFYKNVFGATELMRMPGPDGKIMHAEIKIGDSRIMLGEENPQMGTLSPKSTEGSPLLLYVYAPDVDAVVEKAVKAGAKLDQPVKNQFYGDRAGSVTDPFGYKWFVATHVEDVAPEELKKRAAAMGRSAGAD
jgi:PhnB protein